VYVTGYADPAHAITADEPVITKPYASAELLHVVARVLRH